MKYRIREENELKPSGVEWLGDIPKDWQVSRLKNFCIIKNGSTPKSDNELFWNGNIIWITPQDIGKKESIYLSNSLRKITEEGYRSCGTSLIPKNSIILTTRAPIGNIAISSVELCMNQGCKALIIKNREFKYIYYLLLSSSNILQSLGTGTTFLELSTNNLALFNIPLFSAKEEKKIANFLDEKSKIFDEAISKKEQLISKLELAKQSLISEVVTGKLKIVEQNSKLQTIKREENELKSSGVEWLGDIPKDWKLTKLKYLGDAIIGLTYSPTDVVDKNEGILVLRSSNVQNKRITFEDNVYVKSVIPKKLLTKIDDILICSRNGSRNLIGKNALITEKSQDLTFGAFMTIFRSKYNKYLFYIFNSDIFEAQSASFLSSTINQLTTGNLNNFKIVLPSLEEQQKISKYLDEKLIHFDNTIEKTKQSITKLKEAKEALISQAVTGKIEVL